MSLLRSLLYRKSRALLTSNQLNDTDGSNLFKQLGFLIKKMNKSDIEIFIDSLDATQANFLCNKVEDTPMAYFFAMQNDKQSVDFLLKEFDEDVEEAILGALSKNNNKLALYFFNNASLKQMEEIIEYNDKIFEYKEFSKIISKHKDVLQLLAAKGKHLLTHAIENLCETKVNLFIDWGVPFDKTMENIMPVNGYAPRVSQFLLNISNHNVRKQLLKNIPAKIFTSEEIKILHEESQLLEWIEKKSTQEYRLSVRDVKSYTPSLHTWLLQCSNKNLLPPEINLLITSFILGYSDKETAAFCSDYYEIMPKRLLNASLEASAKKFATAISGKAWGKKIQGLFFQSPERSTYLAECKEANKRFADRVSRKF